MLAKKVLISIHYPLKNKRLLGRCHLCLLGLDSPEYPPCWVCCSSMSSQHGRRRPRSASWPSHTQCCWHRTLHCAHLRFCEQRSNADTKRKTYYRQCKCRLSQFFNSVLTPLLLDQMNHQTKTKGEVLFIHY